MKEQIENGDELDPSCPKLTYREKGLLYIIASRFDKKNGFMKLCQRAWRDMHEK